MSAYVIVDVEINNHEDYEEYKKLTTASVAAYDGSFIVRGGATEVLEGDWSPGRIVVLNFPNVKRAKQWWNSSEYELAKSIRHRSAKTRMIVVEGVGGRL